MKQAANHFAERVADTIREENLFSRSDGMLVALSGGADSVALLRVLVELGYQVEAAHCNFHLRGEESMRDENFVRNLCGRMGVTLHVKDFDTKAWASERGVSIEMAARELRYTWFDSLLDDRCLSSIAVAHHRDDNVETILLNLLRGTGLKGLTGMKKRNGRVVRPLLDVTRQEIIDYLNLLHQNFVTDSTNLETIYTRNRIRLQLLPLMREINPSVERSIIQTAKHLSDSERVIDGLLRSEMTKTIENNVMKVAALEKASSPRLLLFEWLHPKGFTESQMEAIMQERNGQGLLFQSHAYELLVDRGRLVVRKKPENVHEATISLEEGQIINFPLGTISMTKATFRGKDDISREKMVATLDADKIDRPLILRRVKNGDRFNPYGMKGMKLVSDYMTDRKLSRFEKECQWAVCSGEKIAWLVGERVDGRFAVDASTQTIIRIKVNR